MRRKELFFFRTARGGGGFGWFGQDLDDKENHASLIVNNHMNARYYQKVLNNHSLTVSKKAERPRYMFQPAIPDVPSCA